MNGNGGNAAVAIIAYSRSGAPIRHMDLGSPNSFRQNFRNKWWRKDTKTFLFAIFVREISAPYMALMPSIVMWRPLVVLRGLLVLLQ